MKFKYASFFSVTTDLWSSSASQPYLSYTVPFINDDWQLCSNCLQTLFCSEDHTVENLAETSQDTLIAWGLDANKQVCLTIDSGSNIMSAIRKLSWTHLPCFGHILHDAIGQATKAYKTVGDYLLNVTYSHEVIHSVFILAVGQEWRVYYYPWCLCLVEYSHFE